MPTNYHVLAKEIKPLSLNKVQSPKRQLWTEIAFWCVCQTVILLSSDISFNINLLVTSNEIIFSLRMVSTSLLFCRLCTSAVELMLPLDPHWLSSLYSCGWKPTPQTTPPTVLHQTLVHINVIFGSFNFAVQEGWGWRKTVNHGAVERASAITDYHMDFRWG